VRKRAPRSSLKQASVSPFSRAPNALSSTGRSCLAPEAFSKAPRGRDLAVGLLVAGADADIEHDFSDFGTR
jgi:hypothetical protein